ncbi:MAG: hypothetical protein KAT62_11205 [Desulfuromonadales bacterium]|nr:hypothetical protein [Desulfuromonadales bacterium]
MNPQVKVIMSSGFLEGDPMQASLATGVHDFIQTLNPNSGENTYYHNSQFPKPKKGRFLT